MSGEESEGRSERRGERGEGESEGREVEEERREGNDRCAMKSALRAGEGERGEEERRSEQ